MTAESSPRLLRLVLIGAGVGLVLGSLAATTYNLISGKWSLPGTKGSANAANKSSSVSNGLDPFYLANLHTLALAGSFFPEKYGPFTDTSRAEYVDIESRRKEGTDFSTGMVQWYNAQVSTPSFSATLITSIDAFTTNAAARSAYDVARKPEEQIAQDSLNRNGTVEPANELHQFTDIGEVNYYTVETDSGKNHDTTWFVTVLDRNAKFDLAVRFPKEATTAEVETGLHRWAERLGSYQRGTEADVVRQNTGELSEHTTYENLEDSRIPNDLAAIQRELQTYGTEHGGHYPATNGSVTNPIGTNTNRLNPILEGGLLDATQDLVYVPLPPLANDKRAAKFYYRVAPGAKSYLLSAQFRDGTWYYLNSSGKTGTSSSEPRCSASACP